MKFNIILCLMALCVMQARAQKYSTIKSSVVFFSDAPIEDITADNKSGIALLDVASKQVAFSIPIAEFIFEKALMQEHFNEKYMETEKYPKASFQGTLNNLSMTTHTDQSVVASGKLNIHGVTRDVSIPGTIRVETDGTIKLRSTFVVQLKDYKISIPKLLWENIAEQVEVTIDFTLQPKS